MRRALAINVKRLGLTWKLEYDTVKRGTKFGRGDADALGVGQSTERVAWEQCTEELEGTVALGGERGGVVAALVNIVRGERRRRHVRRRGRLAAGEDVARRRGEWQRRRSAGRRTGRRSVGICERIFEAF